MESRAETDRQERENDALREDQRVREAVIARQRIAFALGGALLLVTGVLLMLLVRFNRTNRTRAHLLAHVNAELEETNRDLRTALSEVQTLKGFIPICAHCKSVRDDRGYWEAVETYITNRSAALFSHSICTECGPKLYGSDWSGEPERANQGVQADTG